ANCDVFSSNSADNLDSMAYIRYADVAANGMAFYMGGNNVTQNGNASHLRIILDTLLAAPAGIVPQEATIREVSRSNPIVASVDGVNTDQYQGTFEVVSNGSVT